MITQGMTMEAVTAAVVIKGNKTNANLVPEQDNFSPVSCQRAVSTVFLTASRLRRVRLVVRTQPSQGWYTGSTPVRAATNEMAFYEAKRLRSVLTDADA